MKNREFYLLICVPIIVINLCSVYKNISWLTHFSELMLYIPLLIGFYCKFKQQNVNLFGFVGCSIAALIFSFFDTSGASYLAHIVFSLISYFFLIREAVKYSKREAANKFMLFFFFLLIFGNVFYVFRHLQDMEIHLAGKTEYAIYSLFYINLLILAIVALIYYLNSYSRKSVYFITLVMTLVVADILRDMALFYLQDISVQILQSFLSLSAIVLSILFFATTEKRLKLMNLV